MPKEEWGTKRVCPTTGKRFYDLNADPIVSPYTDEVVTVDSTKNRTMVADSEDAQTKKAKEEAEATKEEDLLLDDDDDGDTNDDVADDVLDDDNDDDDETVSIEELKDVAAPEDS